VNPKYLLKGTDSEPDDSFTPEDAGLEELPVAQDKSDMLVDGKDGKVDAMDVDKPEKPEEKTTQPMEMDTPEKRPNPILEVANDSEDDIAMYNTKTKEEIVPATPEPEDSTQPAKAKDAIILDSPEKVKLDSPGKKSKLTAVIHEICDEDEEPKKPLDPRDVLPIELTELEKNKGYIIILDSLNTKSLGTAYNKPIKNLHKYLKEEAKSRGFSVYENRKLETRLAKGRKQPNHCDCGLYLIKYLEHFLLNNDVLLSHFIVRTCFVN
jgi:hypothetical protein